MRHQAYKKQSGGFIRINLLYLFRGIVVMHYLMHTLELSLPPPFTLRNNKIDICDYYIKTIRGENAKYPATTFVNNLRYG